MELYKANKQWSERPADERFASLDDMYNATKKYADESIERKAEFGDMRVEAAGGEIKLTGRQGIPARLTHWAFGQLCSRVAAPASYLRELPATLAAQNLNHGLAQRVKDGAGNAVANLMFHRNGDMLLRSILTDDYVRIWNYEIVDRLRGLEADYGWTPAKPTMHWGDDTVGTCIMCQGSGKKAADSEESCMYCAGSGKELPALYASDHDMFAFLMNGELTVEEKGSDGALYKGVIVSQSEVGAKAIKLTKFIFRELCGNHIIWGASKVVELNVRHVGNARGKWSAYYGAVRQYAEESTSDLEAKIASLKLVKIGANKEEVLDTLFGKKGAHGLSRVTLEAGYDAVKPDQDGDANTAWGFVQGLTRHSQAAGFADKRNEIDTAAGKILDLF